METETIAKVLLGSGTMAIVYKLIDVVYERLKKLQKPEAIEELGRMLKEKINLPFFKYFTAFAASLIDSLFSKKHFSWKCFYKSFLASALFCLALHLWYFTINTHLLIRAHWTQWVKFIPGFFIFFILYNSLDFFLLLKTRRVLKVILESNLKKMLIVIVFDLTFTFLFATFKFLILTLLLSESFKIDFNYFFNYVLQVKQPIETSDNLIELRSIPSLFFYSTFFYSFFLILYYLSILIARKLGFITSFNRWFQSKFDIEKKPIEFIELLSALLLILLGIITVLIIKF